MQRVNWQKFLAPASVALVGVTSRTGPESLNILENMLNSGYRARYYPVNPRVTEILGLRAYRSVLELPETPDLAVIAVPRDAVVPVVRECVAKGIDSLIVITQGFADADARGAELQAELVEVARAGGARIIGPNTLGVVNNFVNLHTSFVPFMTRCLPIGIICQSGIFLSGGVYFTGGVGIAIDLGNAADVHFDEVLEYLGNDPRLRVIALHMEGLRDGERFLRVAERVAREKPVLVFKTGRSPAGAHAAASHSGSLAGEDEVYEAAFRRCGMLRVRNVEELYALSKTFATYESPSGRRVAVITFTGGGGIAVLDALHDHGLEAAVLSEGTVRELETCFPPWMEVKNPLDIWPAAMAHGYPAVYRLALRQVLADPNVDAVLCVVGGNVPPEEDPLCVADVVKEEARACPHKPVLVWVFGAAHHEYAARVEAGNVVVAYRSPDLAALALARLYEYRHRPRDRGGPVTWELPDIRREEAVRLLAACRGGGGEDAAVVALRLLEHYGLPLAPYRMAASAADVETAAAAVGYPVVLKALSPDFTHKSDVGAVVLNIGGPEDLRRAVEAVRLNVAGRLPEARLTGWLVQRYCPGGVELLVGAKRDPVFGPVILCGLGGIYTEVWREVSFALPPLDPGAVEEMLRRTRAWPLLTGARGRAPANLEAVTDVVLRVSRLMQEHPEVAELDVNPLRVTAEGALVLDARVVLQ